MQYVKDLFALSEHTVVITGGGGAICGSLAEGCVKAGAKVALWGHNIDTLETKKGELLQNGCDAEKIFLFEVDLMDEAQTLKTLDDTVNVIGTVDILINGVGGSSKRLPLIDTDISEYERIVQLNLVGGCLLPSKHFSRYWIKENISGAIINIASMASYSPLSGAYAYSAAKAAVENHTRAMAKELAPHQIRVNAIAPGFFPGKQNLRLLTNEDGSLTERGKNIIVRTPFGRFGKPEELCGAAIFLASEAAGFISGATIPVDGAYLCDNI
jgi:NAD(P)-dependent dehydrogenase (short-subunit alcohol dehydrogenase family)